MWNNGALHLAIASATLAADAALSTSATKPESSKTT